MAGCCGTSGPPTTIAGLVTEGDNVTITGTGVAGNPYVVSSDAAELVTPGDNVTITGAGTAASPYVINGDGVANEITGTVAPGTNVTRTGTGTTADPYVLSSHLPARSGPSHVAVSDPVVTGTLQLRDNPDGSFNLVGPLTLEGPQPGALGSAAIIGSITEQAHKPQITNNRVCAARWQTGATGLLTVNLVLTAGGQLGIQYEPVPAGQSLTFWVDFDYWPAPPP